MAQELLVLTYFRFYSVLAIAGLLGLAVGIAAGYKLALRERGA
jgi:hypothetical protein